MGTAFDPPSRSPRTPPTRWPPRGPGRRVRPLRRHLGRERRRETVLLQPLLAEKQKQPPTPFPANFHHGGHKTLDQLIAETERGVLVTATVHPGRRPPDLLFTGSRATAVLCENGRIVHAVKNMRFNESPIVMPTNHESGCRTGEQCRNCTAVGGARDADPRLHLLVAFRRRLIMPDFTFTRLRYRSGDWDVDQRMPANVLNSLAEYTTISMAPKERVVNLDSAAVYDSPFGYLASPLANFRPPSVTCSARAGPGRFSSPTTEPRIDGRFRARSKSIWPNLRRTRLETSNDTHLCFLRFPDGRPNVARLTAGATTWCTNT